MLDALPFVAGRALRCVGLSAAATALGKFADAPAPSAWWWRRRAPDVGKGELLALLLPGAKEAPKLPGLEVLETQYAFTVPYGWPTTPRRPRWRRTRTAVFKVCGRCLA